MDITKTDNKVSDPKKHNQAEIKKIDILPLYPKSRDNRCGIFGLKQILNYYRENEGKKPLEIDNTTDNQITGFFTAPKTIVDFARAQGYEARCVSLAKSGEEEAQKQLVRLLENDIPVVIVVRPDPTNPRLLHYVTVNGFEKLNGAVKNYSVIDSWKGRFTWTPKELKSFWGNIPYNASHCMIPVTTKDKTNLLPPEAPHRGYEFMEGIALTETGIKSEFASYKDAAGNINSNTSIGAFFDIKFNHHINNNLDWDNDISLYWGKNINNENYTSTSNLESFLGKTYKSQNWKSQTRLGIAAQSYNQPAYSETFAGSVLGIRQFNKNFEYGAEVKAGFINGKPGTAAKAEVDWIIARTRKPMTLRELKLFLEYRKSWYFNGEGGPQIIQGGLKYEF